MGNETLNIERQGVTTGRWPSYLLVVNGVSLGRVKRTMSGGGDRMTPHARYDVWKIHGLESATREEAEAHLIQRARRFGQLPEQQ